MNYSDILKHYEKDIVKREIVMWSRDRWISIHCEERDSKNKLIFIRYIDNKPLKIRDSKELIELFNRLVRWRPRTIYASINQYRVLEDEASLYDFGNIYSSLPTWDIDNELEDWRTTLEVGKLIGNILMDNGISKSLFYIWSGRGLHVHIHPYALSEDVREKYNPLDLTYALVEYIRAQAVKKLMEDRDKYIGSKLKVENKIDIARVFTVPLTIHREFDIVTVALKYDDLESFTLEWVKPDRFRHNPLWREYIDGEADELSLKAYELIGGYPYKGYKRRRKTEPVDKMIRKWLDKYGK